MRKQTLIALMLLAAMFVVASGVMPRLLNTIASAERSREQQTADSIASVDSLNNALDSLLRTDSVSGRVDSLSKKNEVDTTTMDSLELAIYKHNKAIDDSLALDSINRRRKHSIDAPVVYSGNDSMIYYASSKTAHLFGDAKVDYENMKLNSEIIHLSLDSSLVRAEGVTDTTGEKIGTPIFNMGSDKYESDKMAFNFKTKKGLINQVYTEQEDGYLTSSLSKRDSTGAVYMKKGRYTTCDSEHPDFYIALTRAKVRPGKDVIFGPAYLVVADVPLPLAIPYGFFPFSKDYSSGFIMPKYGDETSRGFYLRDGGYYFAISDKLDLKLIGEIYTKGSWGISLTSTFKKRYKFSDSFSASLITTVNGDKGLPDYTKKSDFKIYWKHNQENTASPQRFSAQVSFYTSSYAQNNLTTKYNANLNSESTRTSSVNWSTSFSSIGGGATLSTGLTINQQMRDSSLTLNLPNLSFTIAQFNPFKRKKAVGKERWYEKIYLSYSANINASLTAKENKFFKKSFSKDWSKTIQQQIGTGASFTILNYINVNPTFSFTDNIYLSRLNKSWDDVTMKEKVDTVNCFGNVYNWNVGIGFNTILYGFYKPSPKIFGDKIVAIRHVFKPSISFSYAPNFSDKSYGFYDSYSYTNSSGELKTVDYCRYVGASVSNQMTGSVTFGFDNNVEMKVRSDKDSTGYKKLSIIDQLSLHMSYNFAARTRPLSDLTTSLVLKWIKGLDIRISPTFRTYGYEVVTDANGKETVQQSTRSEYSQGRFGIFTGTSQSFNFTLTPDKIRKWFHPELRDKDKNKKNDNDDDDDANTYDDPNADPDMLNAQKGSRHQDGGKAETDEDGYMKFSMPWSLSVSYGFTLSENTSGTFNKKTMRYPYQITHYMNMSGNVSISKGWNISFSSGYDFNAKALSTTNIRLGRDLHCFNMSASVNLAPYTSYTFTFCCNAATLTDALKYDKQSSFSNAVRWY